MIGGKSMKKSHYVKSGIAAGLCAAMILSMTASVSAEEAKDVSITVFHYMTQSSK